MRTQAFGEEPAGTLLSATSVAETSLDVLTSDITGLVIDVRKEQKNARSAGDAINVALANSDVDVSTAN
jgi:2-C-methyl-D-erythritol 4-phosphate cytidylyltransferase